MGDIGHERVLVFDPGESTGWVFGIDDYLAAGGTIGRDHEKVAQMIFELEPDIVVVERFNLYPGKAKSLSWNSFYPVEVIGVIKYICMVHGVTLVEQAPSIKKYAGGFGADWDEFKLRNKSALKVTEHVKDAYQHWKYYLKFNKKER